MEMDTFDLNLYKYIPLIFNLCKYIPLIEMDTFDL